ncbi:MAG: hypothetical protein ABIH00_09085 [Armatimonadota bacterium]
MNLNAVSINSNIINEFGGTLTQSSLEKQVSNFLHKFIIELSKDKELLEKIEHFSRSYYRANARIEREKAIEKYIEVKLKQKLENPKTNAEKFLKKVLNMKYPEPRGKLASVKTHIVQMVKDMLVSKPYHKWHYAGGVLADLLSQFDACKKTNLFKAYKTAAGVPESVSTKQLMTDVEDWLLALMRECEGREIKKNIFVIDQKLRNPKTNAEKFLKEVIHKTYLTRIGEISSVDSLIATYVNIITESYLEQTWRTGAETIRMKLASITELKTINLYEDYLVELRKARIPKGLKKFREKASAGTRAVKEGVGSKVKAPKAGGIGGKVPVRGKVGKGKPRWRGAKNIQKLLRMFGL